MFIYKNFNYVYKTKYMAVHVYPILFEILIVRFFVIILQISIMGEYFYTTKIDMFERTRKEKRI